MFLNLHFFWKFLVHHTEIFCGGAISQPAGRLYSQPTVGHQHLISKSNCVAALGDSIMFVSVIGRWAMPHFLSIHHLYHYLLYYIRHLWESYGKMVRIVWLFIPIILIPSKYLCMYLVYWNERKKEKNVWIEMAVKPTWNYYIHVTMALGIWTLLLPKTHTRKVTSENKFPKIFHTFLVQ